MLKFHVETEIVSNKLINVLLYLIAVITIFQNLYSAVKMALVDYH